MTIHTQTVALIEKIAFFVLKNKKENCALFSVCAHIFMKTLWHSRDNTVPTLTSSLLLANS